MGFSLIGGSCLEIGVFEPWMAETNGCSAGAEAGVTVRRYISQYFVLAFSGIVEIPLHRFADPLHDEIFWKG
jgi:hypothetical protein